MIEWVADLVFAAVVLLTALIVAQGGAVRGGIRLICVVLAGLFAMNYFEPLATLAIDLADGADVVSRYARFVVLVVLFAAVQLVLWAATRRLLPESPELPARVERPANWLCGLLTGYVLAAVLLTALHTFPGPREFGGCFVPEADRREGPILRIAPDYQWLGFTQHVSEHVFRRGGEGRVFDGPSYQIGGVRSRWSSFPLRYARWRSRLHGSSAEGGTP
jgi:Colicin V production protein